MGFFTLWDFVLLGYFPTWDFFLMEFCPLGFCPLGFCPHGILSSWDFILCDFFLMGFFPTWDFVLLRFFPRTSENLATCGRNSFLRQAVSFFRHTIAKTPLNNIGTDLARELALQFELTIESSMIL